MVGSGTGADRRAHERAGGRKGERPTGLTAERANVRMDIRRNGSAGEPADGRAGERPNGLAV